MGTSLFHLLLSLPCSCFQMEINPVMIFNCLVARAVRRIKQKTLTLCVALVTCVQLAGGDHKALLLLGSGEYRVFMYALSLLCFLLLSLIDSIGNQLHRQGPTPLLSALPQISTYESASDQTTLKVGALSQVNTEEAMCWGFPIFARLNNLKRREKKANMPTRTYWENLRVKKK